MQFHMTALRPAFILTDRQLPFAFSQRGILWKLTGLAPLGFTFAARTRTLL
jgi:hypothetical protein